MQITIREIAQAEVGGMVVVTEEADSMLVGATMPGLMLAIGASAGLELCLGCLRIVELADHEICNACIHAPA